MSNISIYSPNMKYLSNNNNNHFFIIKKKIKASDCLSKFYFPMLTWPAACLAHIHKPKKALETKVNEIKGRDKKAIQTKANEERIVMLYP